MSSRLCSSCHKPLRDGLAFCPSCGARTGELEPISSPAQSEAMNAGLGASTAPVTPAPVTPPPVTPAPSVQPTPPVPPTPGIDPNVARALVDETYARLAASQGAQRSQGRKLGIAVAIAIAVGLIARFGVGALFPAENQDPGELVAELPVDADGGTAKFGDGGKIEVPKRAVAKPTTINVYKRTIDQRVRLNSPTGGPPIVYPPGTLIVYQFGPIDLVFLRPVVIFLPIPAGQDGVVFVAANGTMRFLPGVGTGNTVRLVVNSLNFNRPGAVVVRG